MMTEQQADKHRQSPYLDLQGTREAIRTIKGKRVTVMGLGRFGGGVAAVRFLAGKGARVTVTDLKDEAALADSVAAIRNLGVDMHLGGHLGEDFREADLVLANPAVKPESTYLAMACKAHVPLTTEMSLFVALCPAVLVGITGSNGKSTTTALTAAVLERGGRRVWLGGNIGKPLIEHVEEMSDMDVAVVELSSFMLHAMASLGVSPRISIITNISPNHLDWHGDFAAYAEAKRQIISFQEKDDFAILNEGDSILREWAGTLRSRILMFGCRNGVGDGCRFEDGALLSRSGDAVVKILDAAEVPLPGSHNLENVAAAAAAGIAAGCSPEAIRQAVMDFKPLEHRLELCGTVRGVRYYNDSIATTPESAVAALKSFSEPKTIIAGGYDKKQDMTEFAHECVLKAENVILIGKTAKAIGDKIAGFMVGRSCPRLFFAASLREAVRIADQASGGCGVVLLSPACASYDMFDNFEHRGRSFKEEVSRLDSEAAGN